MEPGVPFALIGAVQLLAVVAGTGLAVAGWLRRRDVAGSLVAVGALVIVVVEIRTALRLGIPTSDDLALLRAAASLALAGGLYAGALGSRRETFSTLGVVIPLAAAGGPSAFAAAAGLLAAAAIASSRRDLVGSWLAAGLALWAAASALMPLADSGHVGPLSVMLLRGAGSIALIVGEVLLARRSLLTKVVSAILAGVVTMAIAAVGVVGNVVVSSYDRQSRDTVASAADGRAAALNDLGTQVGGFAKLTSTALCETPQKCQAFLTLIIISGQDDFVVRVPRRGAPEARASRGPLLSASETAGIGQLAVVRQVLNGMGASRVNVPVTSIVRLTGQVPQVAVIGVAAGKRLTENGPPEDVSVYGMRIGTPYTQRDIDLGGFGLSLLAGNPLQVVASNLPATKQTQLLGIVQRHGPVLGEDTTTIGSQGANPTVALRPLQDNEGATVALLAMTRDPGPALKTERDALRSLFITALVALVLVALIAVLLGRRTVDPVRRLTLAAERVAAGDLTGSVGVTTRDEVGTLARTFDAMTTSLTDLTDDLRNAAVRLETVLSSITDGLLATDGTGAVTSVNRAALAMLGVDEADVLGERLDVVADVRDASGTSLVNLGTVVLDEPAEVHRPDGKKVPVRVVLTPLTNADGVVLVLRDTTREREVERMKTEFLSNVSHELRTPLTPIRGYAEILVSKSGLDAEKVKSFATTIRDESLKMNRVVDLLVDVASVEAGRVHVSPRAVAVRELLDARIAAWQERAPQRTFKRRVSGGLPKVMVDPAWLAKALDELIDNAVKHTSSGPITLLGSLSPDGTHVRVAVKDAGPGISQADQARLFTSFEQVDGSATRRVGGLGLGLSFVRRLAEDAGFPLTVSSVEGKGSEFSLDLPPA